MILDDGMMSIDPETGEILSDMDILSHYGMPRRSGRYPWGSGENPYQRIKDTGGAPQLSGSNLYERAEDFMNKVNQLRSEGKSNSEIAAELGIFNYMGKPSPTELLSQYSVAKDYRRAIIVDQVKKMKADGMNNTEIGEKFGVNESTVRSWLNQESEKRMMVARNTADMIREQIDKKGMIDVGSEIHRHLGITETQLKNALTILKIDGYPVYGGRVPQPTNKNQMTTLRVICPPGTEHKDIYQYQNIHQLDDVTSHDGGKTFDPTWVYPKSLDSKRVMVRYAEDGGKEKDGLVELRPGVEDISLGGKHYGQVRILVDDTHYIKGMAAYGDEKDFPPGVDLIFNTNKHEGTPMLGDSKDNTVLKKIDKSNPTNPFGSLIKPGIVDPDDPEKTEGGQRYYYDKDGKKQLSVINLRSEEGDWGEWSKELPSQFLSKQNQKLVKQQLDLAKIDKQDEFEEISALINPTVKKHLLEKFALDCDKAAVHLKAAALPRQRYQVILPVESLKEDEVYAPNYEPGEKVALIRYPHGGTFEIPILTVVRKNEEAERVISPSGRDAVGINAAVAGRLSGADFDGDTVMVIPLSGRAKITSTPALDELKGFEPKEKYASDMPGVKFKRMTKEGTQRAMGEISNLITDMTIGGANTDEIIRAVKHSMVVIDAAKHNLNYRQSEIDNNIKELKNTYQGHYTADGKWSTGANTIISAAKSEKRVPKYRGVQKIDPNTGKLYWDPNKKPETYRDKNGNIQTRTVKSTRMAETDDAMELVSEGRGPIELLYANYANSMKSLANDARKEMIATGKLEKKPEAAKKYAAEVSDLLAQLDEAEKNRPRERQATLITAAKEKEFRKNFIDNDPDATKTEINKAVKKFNQQAMSAARAEVGAHRVSINITPAQWEAIQNGAISEDTLKKILNHTDLDVVRNYATPSSSRELSQTKQNRIRALQNSGYTTGEIAKAIGVSTSTVQKYLK